MIERTGRYNHSYGKPLFSVHVDFELQLIHRDEINVTYILRLLAKLKDATPEDREKQEKALVELI